MEQLNTKLSQFKGKGIFVLILLDLEQGRRVWFRNALIVMTSNVGSAAIVKGRKSSIGFSIGDDDEPASYAGMKALVREELKAYFRPELLNRLDEIVVFHPLEKDQVSFCVPFRLQMRILDWYWSICEC